MIRCLAFAVPVLHTVTNSVRRASQKNLEVSSIFSIYTLESEVQRSLHRELSLIQAIKPHELLDLITLNL